MLCACGPTTLLCQVIIPSYTCNNLYAYTLNYPTQYQHDRCNHKYVIVISNLIEDEKHLANTQYLHSPTGGHNPQFGDHLAKGFV